MFRHQLKLLFIVVVCLQFEVNSASNINQGYIYNVVHQMVEIVNRASTQPGIRLNPILQGTHTPKYKVAYSVEATIELLNWTWQEYVYYLTDLKNLLQALGQDSKIGNQVNDLLHTEQVSLDLVTKGKAKVAELVANQLPIIEKALRSGGAISTKFPVQVLSQYNNLLEDYSKFVKLSAANMAKASSQFNDLISKNEVELKKQNIDKSLRFIARSLHSVIGMNTIDSEVAAALRIQVDGSGKANNVQLYKGLSDAVYKFLTHKNADKAVVVADLSNLAKIFP